MRRLICIANSIAETFIFRTALGLTNDDIRHFSPYDKPDKMRGMDEKSIAIVWVAGNSDLELSSKHITILEMYISLGVQQYMGYADREAILEWLYADKDWKELRARRAAEREAMRRADLAESSVDLLVKIIRVAVTCAAIEQSATERLAAWLKQRCQSSREAQRGVNHVRILGRIEGEEAVAEMIRHERYRWLPRQYRFIP